MAQQYDKIIKENLEKVVLQLIRKTTEVEPVKGEILYPELQYTIEREADFLEKITTADGQTLIFHIEFQTTNEKAMADRMFVYAGLIYQIYRLPVRQIVFYIGKEPMNMSNTLQMPTYAYSYELINLQDISYKQFINSAIPEEVIMSLLCNFEEVKAETVVEEIFAKLRMLQQSELALQRSLRQLDILSLLRDLQPLILKQEQKMALTLKPENDLRFQQGEKRKALQIATEMLKEGFDKQATSKMTKLTLEEVDLLAKKLRNKSKEE